jgi:hypothetical protein
MLGLPAPYRTPRQICLTYILYIRYRYITYTIEIIVDRAEVGLGRSSLRLVYIYSLRRAFLAPTYLILDRYS